MNGKRSRHQVRFRRQDVTVLANSRDLAVAFHFAEDRVQIHADAAFASQRFAELDFVEGPIIRRAQQIEDAFSKLRTLGLHKVCTLRAMLAAHERNFYGSDGGLSA